jgi:solute carrier family 35 protein F1/2
MSCAVYLMLSSYFIKRFIVKCRSPLSTSSPLSISYPWYWYFLIALCDVEANYLMILAYNYTSMTSIAILDCFAIPCVGFLSYIFLNAQYKLQHIIGTIISIVGIICTILSDILMNNSSTEQEYSNPLYGDILALIAAMLYACSNVFQEKTVKYSDNEEFLGLLGIFGALITFIQGLAVDLKPFLNCQWQNYTIIYFISFIIILFTMYTKAAIFLQNNDSLMFNLSLLTSDIYIILFSYFIFGNVLSWLYFISYFLLAIGLIIYHTEESPINRNIIDNNNNTNILIKNNKSDDENPIGKNNIIIITSTVISPIQKTENQLQLELHQSQACDITFINGLSHHTCFNDTDILQYHNLDQIDDDKNNLNN